MQDIYKHVQDIYKDLACELLIHFSCSLISIILLDVFIDILHVFIDIVYVFVDILHVFL